MCGRFSLATDIGILQEQFNFDFKDELNLRYNISPSQDILVLGSNGNSRVGTTMKWGLVPTWANDTKIGYKMINARSETIDENLLVRLANMAISTSYTLNVLTNFTLKLFAGRLIYHPSYLLL